MGDTKYYRTAEVAFTTGFSVRQLDYWARSKILEPSIQSATGSGTRRFYSFGDLIQLHLIKKLKVSKWSTQRIRLALASARLIMLDENPHEYAVVLGAGRSLVAIFKTKEGERLVIEALSKGGQTVLPLVLETIEQETRQLVFCFVDRGNEKLGVKFDACDDTLKIR